MFTLKPRKDGFRLLFPKEFIPEEINRKYSDILKSAKSFYTKPIDFLNETIRSIDVLGITNATYAQQQTTKGTPTRFANRKAENAFQGASTDVFYRSVANPLSLIDKTLNVTFRHTLGYLNYFLLIETFLYNYSRDTKGIPNLDYNFRVDIMNENGAIYSSLILEHPLIDGIDMLTFDNSQPIAQNETFKCVFKYSNFKYQFIEVDGLTTQVDLDSYLEEIAPEYPLFGKGVENKNPNRIPSFKSSSPVGTIPGNIPYEDRWMSPSTEGQIIYEDEGGVLQDIVHHEKVDTDKTYQKSNGGFTPPNNEKSDSFISMLATERMERTNGLNENEKFNLYPYPKDYKEGKVEMSSFDITSEKDHSDTKITSNGEPTDEYGLHSEWPQWEDKDFVKFRNK